MPEAHARRRDGLRQMLADREVDALLVTRLVNVRYLTGFTGSNGALLLTPSAAVLATDGRYTTQSAAQSPDVERVIVGALAATLAQRAADDGAHRLGFEEHDVTVELHTQLGETVEGVALAPTQRAVESLRVVKDAEEIAHLARACAIADEALAGLLPTIRPGRTERDIAFDLETRMRDLGADGPSFETIVASGANSAVPHHRPTERAVEAGDFVKLDFGALVAGYHSDMTRTVVVGPAADWQREVYALVARAQQTAVDGLRVGATTGELDLLARQVIDDAGHGDDYTHSLGHGVGLEIHEAPTLRSGGSDRLVAGTPVTVEPGVYLPGRGGVRIEDTLVVETDGARCLTNSPRDLIVL